MGCSYSKEMFGKCFTVEAMAGNGEKKSRRRRRRKTNAVKTDQAVRAAVLIQKWYRRHLALIEARHRCTWTIFQSLEYHGEQDQLKLYNFFNNMLTHLPDIQPQLVNIVRNGSPKSNRFKDEQSDELLWESVEVEAGYKGPHINRPVSRLDLDVLLHAFKMKKQLHARYVLQILHQAKLYFQKQLNINQVSTATSGAVTVCGDLHGKLDDLYVIFHKNGLPSLSNPYVFNGDFVDRGKFSVEVFLLLLVCVMVNPGSTYLNRGNHEDHVMNLRYGFVKEVTVKYKVHATKILSFFEEAFAWLPLATLIDRKVLVVHGGISNETDLEYIQRIDRHKYLTLLRSPEDDDDDNDSQGPIGGNSSEWRQVLDILWSDPVSQNGCTPNEFRGGGTYFGPDVTKDVLKKHKLQLLIRSHECKTDGYEFCHQNKCLTVFSASNYYEMGSNRGAYAKLVGKELIPQLVQYTAGNVRRLSLQDRLTQVEKSAIIKLKEMIYSSKTLLLKEFRQCDSDNSGRISVNDWCNVMAKTVQLNLPWRMLKDRLVKTDEDNDVIYATTFEEFSLEHNKYSSTGAGRVGGGTIAGNVGGVMELLYKNKSNLETIFRLMDKDNSGHVTMEEFEGACRILSSHLNQPISQEQMKQLANSIDINNDGIIEFNEFLEAFRLVDRSMMVIDVETNETELQNERNFNNNHN
ncbi:protein phosphatase, EF-hand calcium binding domain [Chamberlinius hualienensis]